MYTAHIPPIPYHTATLRTLRTLHTLTLYTLHTFNILYRCIVASLSLVRIMIY